MFQNILVSTLCYLVTTKTIRFTFIQSVSLKFPRIVFVYLFSSTLTCGVTHPLLAETIDCLDQIGAVGIDVSFETSIIAEGSRNAMLEAALARLPLFVGKLCYCIVVAPEILKLDIPNSLLN